MTTETAGDGPEHLSIGEVLALLQAEFADVTISKIRFLESQGLIAPERTPSGYRKFYAADIARLRWILRCQRDRFLPLRVIKARLASDPDIDFDAPPDASGPLDATSAGGRQPELFETSEPPADPPAPSSPGLADPPTAERPPRRRGAAARPTAGPETGASDPGAWLAALQEGPPGRPRIGARTSGASPEPRTTAVPSDHRTPGVPVEPQRAVTERLLDGARYTLAELAVAADVTEDHVEELIRFGLVESRSVGGVATFDGHAVAVARATRYFMTLGIDPRHLRMYKLGADREAGLFEQLIMPLLRQRNPRARQEAIDRLSELIDRGEQLRAALVTQALRDHLGG